MRKDMHKLLVMRPRVAHYQSWIPIGSLNRRRNAYRAAKQFHMDIDLDVCDTYSGTKQPMKSRLLGYKLKMFGENLKPLKRFLKSRVGFPWDDVYSEIRTVMSTRTTLQHHVFQHLFWEVCTKTQLTEDGRVICSDEFHGYCDYEGQFYVEPVTGLLRVGVNKREIG